MSIEITFLLSLFLSHQDGQHPPKILDGKSSNLLHPGFPGFPGFRIYAYVKIGVVSFSLVVIVQYDWVTKHMTPRKSQTDLQPDASLVPQLLCSNGDTYLPFGKSSAPPEFPFRFPHHFRHSPALHKGSFEVCFAVFSNYLFHRALYNDFHPRLVAMGRWLLRSRA